MKFDVNAELVLQDKERRVVVEERKTEKSSKEERGRN
jgi:hypothetical protein